MTGFDIRITGEQPDQTDEQAERIEDTVLLMALALRLRGFKIDHIMSPQLDAVGPSVVVHRVEVSAVDPDRWIIDMNTSAKEAMESSGQPDETKP